MSMISDQCDGLRDLACELRKLANGPVNEGFPAREKLFESADAMCQAADTIWELRCKLAGVVDQRYEIERLKAENAKLRDFVYDMWNDMNVYYTQHESPNSSDMDFYRDRMRELGVEVDGR
jgi:hypothetical protein